jgi:cytochrome c-type biogenesis protein CcmH/NrfG
MLGLWPDDPAVENDEAYTRLLLFDRETRQNLNSIEQLAEKLVQHDPASLPHRTLLALARLRQNRLADALAVYSNIQVTPGALTPSALAVHAAVLEANGKHAEAQSESEQISMEKLLPEERQLIDSGTTTK